MWLQWGSAGQAGGYQTLSRSSWKLLRGRPCPACVDVCVRLPYLLTLSTAASLQVRPNWQWKISVDNCSAVIIITSRLLLCCSRGSHIINNSAISNADSNCSNGSSNSCSSSSSWSNSIHFGSNSIFLEQTNNIKHLKGKLHSFYTSKSVCRGWGVLLRMYIIIYIP